ncbi:hypothetical protein [Sphaerisporangium aureirubrum]|uniref:Uncharacterized protein n=1 Tax=Sphaerisporangium aureirubrum TaxID=1544736 RepID=A0ABW1NCK6_9ACTN
MRPGLSALVALTVAAAALVFALLQGSSPCPPGRPTPRPAPAPTVIQAATVNGGSD